MPNYRRNAQDIVQLICPDRAYSRATPCSSTFLGLDGFPQIWAGRQRPTHWSVGHRQPYGSLTLKMKLPGDMPCRPKDFAGSRHRFVAGTPLRRLPTTRIQTQPKRAGGRTKRRRRV